MLTPAVQANSIIFTSGSQSNSGGSLINVRADFDINNAAKTVTIYLLDLQANPNDVASVLSSVRFQVTGAGATPTPALANWNFATFDIDRSSGAPTNPINNNTTGNSTNLWKASNFDHLNTISLCANCPGGGNKQLVVGAPSASGIYTGNASLKVDPHQPFIIGSGGSYSSGALNNLNTSPNWTLHFSDITPGQTVMISNVTFGFGTTYGAATYTMANYTQYDAPEPESNIMVVTGLGLVLIAVAARRYRLARS